MDSNKQSYIRVCLFTDDSCRGIFSLAAITDCQQTHSEIYNSSIESVKLSNGWIAKLTTVDTAISGEYDSLI